jgi:ubiquinone/menaquinone biosynthesis C-methylase UbiE
MLVAVQIFVGDIRVDLSFNFLSMHLRSTVLADAKYLPFKNGNCRTAKGGHVLENLRKPFKALKEMIRIVTRR